MTTITKETLIEVSKILDQMPAEWVHVPKTTCPICCGTGHTESISPTGFRWLVPAMSWHWVGAKRVESLMKDYTPMPIPEGYVQKVPSMQTCKICSKQLIGRYYMAGQGFVCLPCGATLADNGYVVDEIGPSINIEELKHRRFNVL